METNIEMLSAKEKIENMPTTEFNIEDGLLDFKSEKFKTPPITLLGFYLVLRHFINRKDSSKDNQEAYSQDNLKKKMKVNDTTYSNCIKVLFNTTILDIKKYCRVDYLIIVGDDSKGIKMIDDILVYSSLNRCEQSTADINIAQILAQKHNVKTQNIKISFTKNIITYIVNEYPEPRAVINGKLIECRDWDIEFA